MSKPQTAHAEDYPETVQARKDGVVWYFRKTQRGRVDELDHDPVEFSHVEIEGAEYEAVKQYPWSVPDVIAEMLEAKGYTVIA